VDQQKVFRGALANADRALNWARSFARVDPQQRAVTVSFTADRMFNARARRFAVDIHASVLPILQFLFNQLLCWPDVCRHIGKPRRETRWGELASGIPLSLPSSLSVTDAVRSLPSHNRPIDDRRALAASGLADLVATFCVFHEVCHVVLGHAGALERQYGHAELLEFYSRRPATLPSHRVCRAWEYEADIHAAYMATSSLFSDENRPHFTEVFAIESLTREYEPGVLWTWFFALHTLFLYLAQRGWGVACSSSAPAGAVGLHL